jgi:4a-hydroxytetrahydrobiopterin dehydratase
MKNLDQMYCHDSKDVIPLSLDEINKYLTQVEKWHFSPETNFIWRSYEFKNFKQTIFFINALAFMCEKECHHPTVTFTYNTCQVEFNTHDINGISINDFICAKKADNLFTK